MSSKFEKKSFPLNTPNPLEFEFELQTDKIKVEVTREEVGGPEYSLVEKSYPQL